MKNDSFFNQLIKIFAYMIGFSLVLDNDWPSCWLTAVLINNQWFTKHEFQSIHVKFSI